MSGLFRDQVVKARATRLDGEVFLGVQMPLQVVGYVLIASVVAGMALVCVARYDRKEVVRGWLVPEGGLIRVISAQGGLIGGIDVTEGQQVRAGETLATVKLSQMGTAGDSGEKVEAAALAEQTAAADNATQKLRELRANHEDFLRQLQIVQALKSEGQNLLGILQSKEDLAEKQYARVSGLGKEGFISQQGLDDQYSKIVDAKQAISSQKSSLLALDEKISELKDELQSEPILEGEQQAEATSNEASLRQKLEQIKIANGYSLSAPVNGFVTAIPVKNGQSLTEGQTAFIIAPKVGKIIAELYVPSGAVGFIKPGQKVSLHYQAYSYKMFGAATGRILSVSPSAMGPSDVAMPAAGFQEPVYKVDVGLSRPSVHAYGADIPLKTGMLLDASIDVERRSLVDWLFDPIYAVRRK